ncbi:MAG: amidohydrolase family protein, partial [Mycobacterium sp.]
PHLERRILDYVTANLNVTAGGIFSNRMLTQALEVLGPDRVMFGQDDPYGAQFGGNGGAREFVDAAPLSPQDKAKFAHLNAERLLGLRAVDERRDDPPIQSP